MAQLIEVEERNISYIFDKPKPYSLDVYQRDYRWSDEKDYKIVSQLLKDIELQFKNNFRYQRENNRRDLTAILNDVEQSFTPYFLNTIMLNEQRGNIYIVDGQQRLTTLLIMLIKLYHIGLRKDDAILNVEKVIGEKIYEEGLDGVKQFKISNEDRNRIIKMIFEDEEISNQDINNLTQHNLVENYKVISKYYDELLLSEDRSLNSEKYNYYVYYLLQKVLLVEQIIKRKEDVAMIFESANDRGKTLEPHEVLKGMLLGVLDVKPKEKCNQIWDEALTKFYEINKDYSKVDDFFRTYFRAKYADTAFQYEQFSYKYHRNLISNDRILKDLDGKNPDKIEKFLKNDFVYFYKTYIEIFYHAQKNTNIHIASNYANEQGQQYLLILSALNYNDTKHNEKINLVAKKLDQFYSITRLIGAGDNNKRQKAIYEINYSIRNKSLDEISKVFDKLIIKYLNNNGFPVSKLNEIFQYKYFKNAKVDGRFTKYILARIDKYLSDILHEQSFANQESLHFITHSGSSPVNGFHIEHIFSNNEKIMEQFKDENNEFDEKMFYDERERIGAVLLLKGNENLRTGNWIYKDKYNSYSNSGFIWNRILTDSINPASKKAYDNSIQELFTSFKPDSEGLLPREAIDKRQYILFQIIKDIFSNQNT